jgi:hypothetical protein
MGTSVLMPAAILTVISLFVQRRIHFIGSVVVYVLGVGLKIVKWGTLLGIIMVDCLHFEVQNVWFAFQRLNVSFFDCFEILCDPRLVFFIVNDIPSIQIFPSIHFLIPFSLLRVILLPGSWVFLMNFVALKTVFLFCVAGVALIIIEWVMI